MNLGFSVPATPWALVRDGRVIDLRDGERGAHPYGDLPEGTRAVAAHGIHAEIGYVVDVKGNIAPPLHGGASLPEGEPAYVDRSHVPAAHTAVQAKRLYTGEPHPLERIVCNNDAP